MEVFFMKEAALKALICRYIEMEPRLSLFCVPKNRFLVCAGAGGGRRCVPPVPICVFSKMQNNPWKISKESQSRGS